MTEDEFEATASPRHEQCEEDPETGHGFDKFPR